MSHNTVRRYLNSPEAMRPKPRPPRGSRLDPYAEHIDRRMGEGLENCRVLMVDALRYLARRPGGGHRRSTGVDGRAGPSALGQLGHLDGRGWRARFIEALHASEGPEAFTAIARETPVRWLPTLIEAHH